MKSTNEMSQLLSEIQETNNINNFFKVLTKIIKNINGNSKFEERKQKILKKVIEKEDKSRKGEIDNPILKLLLIINGLKNYYTTSSCSGRILLQSSPLIGKKWENQWFFVSHDKVSSKELLKELNKLKYHKEVWFRVDPAIIHIAAQNLDSATKMLQIVRECGFKRSGIISLNKLIIEVQSTESLEMPIIMNDEIIIKENALKELVDVANKKLKRTHEKIKKLEDILIKKFYKNL